MSVLAPGNRTAPLVRPAAAAAFLAAAGCGAKIESPDRVPYVEVWDLAQFGDLDQEYGAALLLEDFDQDGDVELITGSPSRDPAHDGVVLFISIGTVSIVDAVFPWLAPGETTLHHDEYGASLVVGDWNGDGRRDLAVGDPGADVGATEQAGETWVYLSPIDAATPLRLAAPAPATGARFGETLACGDFDHDGCDDLAIGAPHPADVAVSGGGPSLTVCYGPDFVRREQWDAGGAGGSFGAALVAVPQPEGGAALVAGAPEFDEGHAPGGFFAWERFLGGSALQVAATNAADVGLGRAGACGDFDGDGRDELAVTALDGRGAVAFFGGDTFERRGRLALPSRFAWRAGAPAAAIPDVTGDGAAELLLLSSRPDDPAALLFSPGRGLAHLTLDFAASAVVVANFDDDAEPEMLVATPTRLQKGGGLADLRLIDVSWQAVTMLRSPRRAPVALPGVAALLGR